MFVVVKAGVHSEVYRRPDTQYVIVDVSTDGVPDPVQTVRDAVRLSLDSRQYSVVERDLYRNQRKKNAVSVALSAPASVSANTGKVVWTGESSAPDAAWRVPQDVLDALTAPPEFAVTAFEVPAETTEGSAIEAAVTVRNSGGSDGTFVAELGPTSRSDQPEVRLRVPRGETTTRVESVRLYGKAGSDETITLDWGAGTAERSVHIGP